MLGDIKLFNIASTMARHAADRHQLITENIANADTNGYKAKDLEPFTDALARIDRHDGQGMSAALKGGDMHWRVVNSASHGATAPNGNTVSLEDQMVRSTQALQDHEAATAIYKKAIDILRTSLGRNL